MNDPCLSTLLRLLDESAGTTLWLIDENLTASDISAVPPREGLRALTNRIDAYRALQKTGIPAVLSDFELDAPDSFDRVVYRVSKERALVHHCINQAADWLRSGGELCLLGQKNEGIKTHARKAESVLGDGERVQKLGLCYLTSATKADLGEVLPSDDYPELREIQEGEFHFVSKPGIFAWNRVDRGSRVLIQTLEQHLDKFNTKGRLLDLGCGWGYLTLATAELEFSQRVATDNNITALRAAEENFARNQLSVETLADDCGEEIKTQFDLILCNPPFHQGFTISEELSQKFIRQCARLLAPRGTALLVVNQFIPLEKLGSSHFQNIEEIARGGGFKVFAVSNIVAK